MSKRQSSFIPESTTSEVSRNLDNTAYDNVKKVADNIGAVSAVAAGMSDQAFQDLLDNITQIITLSGLTVEIASLYDDSAAIVSLYNDKATLDSLYADKTKLDSIYADKAVLDSLFADKATLDSLFADKATLDSIYADKAKLDIIFASIANVDTVADNIADVSTVAVSISDVGTVATGISDVSTVADNMSDVTYFADRYLGDKAVAPTLRNDGSLLQEGDLYFDTGMVAMQVYNGDTWIDLAATKEPLYSGFLTQDVYTDNLDGTITLSNNFVALYSSVDFTGTASVYELTGTTFSSLVDGVTNYIVASYNTGNPQYQVTQDVSIITESSVVPYLTVFREGTTLLVLPWDTLGLGLANKLNSRLVKTRRFERASGLALSESGTRELNVTAGSLWYGGVSITLAAVNSVIDSFCAYYHVAGSWFKNSSYTAYNNSHYDNGTDLVPLTANRYAVNWIYRCVCDAGRFCSVIGTEDYSLNDALASQPPSSLPTAIGSQAMLLGRVIVQKGSDTAVSIDSAFDIPFNSSAATDHNELANLQGGTVNDYQHLTTTELDHVKALEYTNEPNGFNRYEPTTMGDISFDQVTRTFTIEPQGGETEFHFFSDGKQVVKTSSETVQLPDVTGLYLLYFNGTDSLIATTSITDEIFLKYCLVAYIYWNTTTQEAVGFGDERHGIQMDGFTHSYLHNTEGARYVSGMTPDLSDNSSVLGVGGVSSGVFYDEDILHNLPQQLVLPIHYLTGTTWVKDTASTALSKDFGNGRPAYNWNNGGNWEQGDPGNNDYVLMHLFATNNITNPYILVQGQDQYNNLGSARTGANIELGNLYTEGLPSPEFVAIATFILDENREIALTDDGDVFVDWRYSERTGGSTTPTDHASLVNRSAADQHPIAAITGLVTTGDGLSYLSNDGTYKLISGGSDSTVYYAVDPTTAENLGTDVIWINTSTGTIFLCTDATTNANVWVEASGDEAVWGNITGTLANQTDLQNALDGKASNTHTHIINDLTDVDTATTPPTDGQALVYNTATSKWEAGDVQAGGDVFIDGGNFTSTYTGEPTYDGGSL